MKRRLLQWLQCTACNGELTLHGIESEGERVKQGTLTCRGCAATYPVTDFIPRFVSSDRYASGFSFEWKIHSRTQLDTRIKQESQHSFFTKLGFQKDEPAGQLVLDAGCGMGRYSDVALKAGAEVVAVDLSYAVDSAFKNLRQYQNVHVVQADIFNLPFKKEIFHSIFSIGVLHHTPDTQQAFVHLLPHLTEGGKIGIWLYDNYDRWHTASTNLLRKLTTRLPKRMLYALCCLAVPAYYIYKIPLLGHILRRTIPISMRREVSWRILDTFDWYSPAYQWKHRYAEVFSWFRENGLTVTHLGETPLGVTGTKTTGNDYQ